MKYKTVSVYSSKGGTSKSTIAVNLAAWFASLGKQVCVVDCDPQRTICDLYQDNLSGFDVRTVEPRPGQYDLVIFDHHPSHESIKLGEFVICPIRPSRIDFESYKRGRAFIGDTPHMLVVTQWSLNAGDDKDFNKKLKDICADNKIPFNTIKMRSIYKNMTNKAKTIFDIKKGFGVSESKGEIRAIGEYLND